MAFQFFLELSHDFDLLCLGSISDFHLLIIIYKILELETFSLYEAFPHVFWILWPKFAFLKPKSLNLEITQDWDTEVVEKLWIYKINISTQDNEILLVWI